MTLQWIPLDALEPHPENSNRMPPHLVEKLKGHIQRTGLYEPLVVRPLQCRVRSEECGVKETEAIAAEPSPSTPHSPLPTPHYQILNGHHRTEVLRQLGHSHARCDVWEVDEQEALILLATLNRLEGRDNPASRARLVAHLAESRPPGDLADLLPEPPDAVERLLAMARPPAAPLAPDAVAPRLAPMTFFLSEEQRTAVTEALGRIQQCGMRSGECGVNGNDSAAPASITPHSALATPHSSRSSALERLAVWYLESVNQR
jgi:hypothetical protein